MLWALPLQWSVPSPSPNAQGRLTPITTTTSMKTFSTQRQATSRPLRWAVRYGYHLRGNLFRLGLSLLGNRCRFTSDRGLVRIRPLRDEGPMKALSMAIDFYRKYNVELSPTHTPSDRGVQYCCNEYVDKLKSLGIQISMTQSGDPLHNALAERMNNTLKNGWLFSTEDKSLQQVRRLTKKSTVQHVQTASESADRERQWKKSRKVDGITSSAHIIKSNNKERRQKQPQQEKIKRVILQLEDNCQLTM